MSSINQLTPGEIDIIYTYDPEEEFLEVGGDLGGGCIYKLRYDQMGCCRRLLRDFALGPLSPENVVQYLLRSYTQLAECDDYDRYTLSIKNCDETKKAVLTQKIERLFREAILKPTKIKIVN